MAKGQEIPEESRKRLEKSFKRMMSALFREEEASLRIELLEEPEVTGFINEHARVLDSSFAEVEMSDTMRAKLRESDYIFSGIKTFHELNEAFPSLLDEKGNRKPFNQFLNDVQKIDDTYNKAYLHAEYNHAHASAEMAAKWEGYEEDGDEYYLQYRTAGDDKVRPEHAALNGVTLPMSDPFWDEYFPPNGWNCRCTVVQVLKEKYPATDRAEAFRRGQEALAKDTKGIFHFNPGKQEKTFPDYNPYTISKCNNCTRKLNLSKDIAENELCEACLYLRAECKGKIEELPPHIEEYISHENDMVLQSPRHGESELEENLALAKRVSKLLGKKVYLLPRIDSNTETQNRERAEYMPAGVMPRKNPDYKIEGLPGFYDGKNLYGFKGGDFKQQKQCIENHYKSAKRQADNMVFDVPDNISRNCLDATIRNILAHSSQDRTIIVFHQGKGHVYKK